MPILFQNIRLSAFPGANGRQIKLSLALNVVQTRLSVLLVFRLGEQMNAKLISSSVVRLARAPLVHFLLE